jgi:hypothetical protein
MEIRISRSEIISRRQIGNIQDNQQDCFDRRPTPVLDENWTISGTDAGRFVVKKRRGVAASGSRDMTSERKIRASVYSSSSTLRNC